MADEIPVPEAAKPLVLWSYSMAARPFEEVAFADIDPEILHRVGESIQDQVQAQIMAALVAGDLPCPFPQSFDEMFGDRPRNLMEWRITAEPARPQFYTYRGILPSLFDAEWPRNPAAGWCPKPRNKFNLRIAKQKAQRAARKATKVARK